MHLTFFLLLLPAITAAMSETELMARLLHHYNKHEPPRSNAPTQVQLGFYINNIAFHGKNAMVTMYLRQAWNDPRLTFNSADLGSSSVRVYNLDQIWVPDTFFRNDLYSFVHEQTVPNKLMKLNSTGHIWYVMKISMKLPFRQSREGDYARVLSLMAESFGYTADTMYFSPLDSPLELDHEIGANVDKTVRDCTQSYPGGTFTCLDFQLKFRSTSDYMKERSWD